MDFDKLDAMLNGPSDKKSKSLFEIYLELSDGVKISYLEDKIKKLKSALEDSNGILEQLEKTEWDEEGQIKCQLEFNYKLIQSLPL